MYGSVLVRQDDKGVMIYGIMKVIFFLKILYKAL